LRVRRGRWDFILCPCCWRSAETRQQSRLTIVVAVIAAVLVVSGSLLYLGFQPGRANSKSGSLNSKILYNGCSPAVASACAGTSLQSANLADANLTDANFSHYDLSFANLENASLVGANFNGANLANADLLGANITNAKLDNAYLCGTIMPTGYVNDADCSG